MDPTNVIECASACTVTVVHVISIPPFDISLEDAKQIAGAILAVWAVGAVFRWLAQQIHSGKSSTSETE